MKWCWGSDMDRELQASQFGALQKNNTKITLGFHP